MICLLQQTLPKLPGDKGRSKKSKEPKPWMKKLKYHQYIPPDQKQEVIEMPMDSAYARLLQQQQQFLQLQILSQQQQQQQHNYTGSLPSTIKYGCILSFCWDKFWRHISRQHALVLSDGAQVIHVKKTNMYNKCGRLLLWPVVGAKYTYICIVLYSSKFINWWPSIVKSSPRLDSKKCEEKKEKISCVSIILTM